MDESTRAAIADLLSLNQERWDSAQSDASRSRVQYPLILREVYPDGIVPPHQHGGWERFDFRGDVIFDDLEFPAGFTFQGARFAGSASFVDTRFLGPVVFREIRIGKGVRFERTVFAASVAFNGGQTYSSGAQITFKDVRAIPSLTFDEFSSSGNSGVTFEAVSIGDLSLRRAQLNGILSLMNVHVTGDAKFDAATFRQGIVAKECTFDGVASFVNTALLQAATFDGTKFLRNANFHIEPTTLDPQRSNADQMHFSSFVGARFQERARFDRRRFIGQVAFTGAHFQVAPEFFDVEFADEVDFERATYGSITKDNAAEAERRYRALKLKVSEKQSHRQELIFFAQEMAAKRWTERDAGIAFLHACYGALSGFGQSVGRPLIGLACVYLLFAALYALGLDSSTIGACIADSKGCFVAWERIGSIATLSFAGLAPFLDAGKLQVAALTTLKAQPAPLWLNIALWVEALVALLFLFLVGLGLRNVFRLK